MSVRIAQLSDIHIGFDRANPREDNLLRLEAVLDRLANPAIAPDLILLTGDLTEHGDDESYARLNAALARIAVPIWPIPGNHDTRAGLRRAFAQVPQTGEFVHYTLDCRGLRVVMLDTHEPGRHGAGFCAARADWLQGVLAEAPDTPTMVVMHHPPFVSGIDWMDPLPGEAWIARFAGAIAGHGQVRAIACGHVHRTCVTSYRGITAMICPSTAASVTLHPGTIDADDPDHRPMISDETPGLMLHLWDGASLLTHAISADAGATLASHDGRMSGLLRALAAERG